MPRLFVDFHFSYHSPSVFLTIARTKFFFGLSRKLVVVRMASSDGERRTIVEYHETIITEYTFSAIASRTYSPQMRVSNRPNGSNSHNTKSSPSPFVPNAPSNVPMVLARSSDTASRGALDTSPFNHEFKIIQPPPYQRSRLPWHQSRNVICLLGRGMLAKYIPTFLYFWLCHYEDTSPHQSFDRADLRHLQEFNRVMQLLYTIVTRWWTGNKSGKILFETQVVNTWNEGQQLYSNLIQLLLLAQSRAFAMTGRKETDAANWVRVGGPHEREGNLFFRQLNDEDLGFNQVLSDCDRWNNACWIWLSAPGSESLLF